MKYVLDIILKNCFFLLYFAEFFRKVFKKIFGSFFHSVHANISVLGYYFDGYSLGILRTDGYHIVFREMLSGRFFFHYQTPFDNILVNWLISLDWSGAFFTFWKIVRISENLSTSENFWHSVLNIMNCIIFFMFIIVDQ